MANAVLKMNQSCLSFFSQDWSFFIQVHLVWSENSFFSSSVIQVFHYVCFVGMRRSWEGCVPDLSLLGAYVTYEICFLTHCSYRRPSLERTKNDNNHLWKKIKKNKKHYKEKYRYVFGGCFKQTCHSDISVDFLFLRRRVIAYMEKFGFIPIGCEF